MKRIIILALIVLCTGFVNGQGYPNNYTGTYTVAHDKYSPFLIIKQKKDTLLFEIWNFGGLTPGSRIGNIYGAFIPKGDSATVEYDNASLNFQLYPTTIKVVTAKQDAAMPFPGFETTNLDPDGIYIKTSNKLPKLSFVEADYTSDLKVDDNKPKEQQLRELTVQEQVALEYGSSNAPKEEVYSFVEQPPTFPGGEIALNKFISKNLRIPKAATDNGIGGTVFTNFIVHADGSITDIKTTGNKKGAGLEEEAIRVVQMMPKWIPGKQNGKAVSVQFNIPIRFELRD